MKAKIPLHSFQSDVSIIEHPNRLNYPFYYVVSELALIASREVQEHLIKKTNWNYDFGMQSDSDSRAMGKMFGVLVVKDADNNIGYLAGFSGKIGNSNHFEGFVPPVYDMLKSDGYFKQEEEKLNQLTSDLDQLKLSTELSELKSNLEQVKKETTNKIHLLKEQNKNAKKERDQLRSQCISNDNYEEINQKLKQESKSQSLELKIKSKAWKEEVVLAEEALNEFQKKIQDLKELRAQTSNQLQGWLFEQYNFLNALGESKNLLEIFQNFNGTIPPGGSGECAAPKLFQFAYNNNLKPITFAEFWWGKPPSSEIRKHKQFYPSCRSKCEPILSHMLQGLKVENNPMLNNPAKGKSIQIIFEDEYLAVIHKPHEFLSVPGKNIHDSVYERVKKLYPKGTGPLIVHRLDMSTSGLMLIAKDKKTHEKLQKQFLDKTIQKRYVALLEGDIKKSFGEIKLPLRVDLDNRPQQLVCFEHGKEAHTKYEIVEHQDGYTKIYFYPITGRTHQLRVHAAHQNGLNAPIKGDDLYGIKADRLYLQAQKIEFKHPVSGKLMTIEDEYEF